MLPCRAAQSDAVPWGSIYWCRGIGPRLFQTGTAEGIQIMLQFVALHDRHFARNPSERDVGLCAVQLLDGGGSEFGLSGHDPGGGEHAVAAAEIASLTDGLARQPHRLIVIASNELRVCGDAHIDGREWIARAQAERAADRPIGVLKAAGIGQSKSIIALG